MYQRYGNRKQLDNPENQMYQEQLSSIIGPTHTEEEKDNFYITQGDTTNGDKNEIKDYLLKVYEEVHRPPW